MVCQRDYFLDTARLSGDSLVEMHSRNPGVQLRAWNGIARPSCSSVWERQTLKPSSALRRDRSGRIVGCSVLEG